jgi:hypothetical protein
LGQNLQVKIEMQTEETTMREVSPASAGAETVIEAPKKNVSLSKVISLMNEGYTRKKGDKGYNPTIGSVQEFYDLGIVDGIDQADELFRHPSLKGKRVRIVKPSTLNIIDDTAETTETTETVEETASTGGDDISTL